MFNQKVCLVIFLLVSLSACKLRIVVPPNGHVESVSGTYYCAGGSTCDIEVTDFLFNEKFRAVADSGYSFGWWQSGDNTVCRNKRGACSLSTAGLKSTAFGRDILDSNDIYFLRPVFNAPLDEGELRDLPAEVCFNPDTLEKGFTYETFTQYFQQDGSEYRIIRNNETIGQESFQGQTTTRFDVDSENRIINRDKYTSTSWTVMNLAQQRSMVVGNLANAGPIEITVLYDPGVLFRWDLDKDDEYARSYTATSTNDSFPGETVAVLEARVIYDGVQTITVPAGTFDACRYHSFIGQNGNLVESYSWQGVENGLDLMTTDGEFNPTSRLLSSDLVSN